ncbi:hypothetical protein FSP39_019901 [Pinctada imbricata]|uniref:Peptidase M14 domain-containing protein n=1 Tax=Pinctada imbricata TaxID=66713 RepID=A0AA88XZZ2_PINIB|nr:hypothetical protein FSP39_019901 [Pinctada imbricata]
MSIQGFQKWNMSNPVIHGSLRRQSTKGFQKWNMLNPVIHGSLRCQSRAFKNGICQIRLFTAVYDVNPGLSKMEYVKSGYSRQCTTSIPGAFKNGICQIRLITAVYDVNPGTFKNGIFMSNPTNKNLRMFRFLAFGIFVSLVLAMPKSKMSYEGHQVVKVLPRRSDDVTSVLDIVKNLNLDTWNVPKTLNQTVDVHVTPDKVSQFMNEIKSLGLEVHVWIDNLQRLIDEEHHDNNRRKRASTFHIGAYHYASDINSFLDYVASVSSRTQVFSMGHSYEGRDMKYVKISSGQASKAVYLDGGIHAREWISVSTMVYIIYQLALNPNNDAAVDALLAKFDFYILPVVNPDGYEYSIHHERLWRKNRRPNSHSSCVGVDLNRNFGFQWNPDNGGSRDPCNEIYAGEQSMTEPEIVNVAKFMDSHSNIIAYLNVHSYGQYWLYPWGFTSRMPSDYRDLDNMGRAASNAIYQKHHARYTVGEDTVVLYAAAGGADDYAKGHAGIKYSYTVELRDTGRYGFVLSPSYIIPVGEEILEGVKAFANGIIAKEGL